MMRRTVTILSILLAGGFSLPSPFVPRLAAQEPGILVDVVPGAAGSSPSHFIDSGASAFFRAGSDAVRLWVSDGTPPGTGIVPSPPLAEVPYVGRGGGHVYFVAEGEGGDELWVSSGTEATTRRLTVGLELGDCTDDPCRPVSGAASADGHFVVFVATGAAGAEPWFSDGTPGGTRVLGDLRPGSAGSRPTRFVAVGSTVFFVADEGEGDALWSVGPGAAAVRLTGPLPGLRSEPMAVTEDRLYFVYDRSAAEHSRGLWASDGTKEGTELVHRLAEDPGLAVEPPRLFPTDRRVFLFELVDDTTELSTSDGTSEGTRILAELPPFDPTRGQRIAAHGETLLFWVDDPDAADRVPWISDGTFAGTHPLEICPGGCGEGPAVADPAALSFFSFDDGVHGRELWVTDGTPGGTVMVADVCRGICSSFPVTWRAVGGSVVFVADDGVRDRELWASPVEGPPKRLSDFASSGWFGLFPETAVVGDILLFRADDGVRGLEPWRLELGGGTAPCVEGSRTLCLQGGRFEVSATFLTSAGRSGEAMAVPLTSDTGYLWFFRDTNVEVVVKVLRGCGINGHFWVFAGGLTDVEVNLSVRDSDTGVERTYTNARDTAFQPIQDTSAFPTCP